MKKIIEGGLGIWKWWTSEVKIQGRVVHRWNLNFCIFQTWASEDDIFVIRVGGVEGKGGVGRVVLYRHFCLVGGFTSCGMENEQCKNIFVDVKERNGEKDKTSNIMLDSKAMARYEYMRPCEQRCRKSHC